MEILAFPFAIWFLGAIIAWPYFWFTKGHRGQDAFERRITSLGHGLAWPYYAYKYFSGKADRANEAQQLAEQKKRILSGENSAPQAPPPAAGTSPGASGAAGGAAGSGSQIANPFDNR